MKSWVYETPVPSIEDIAARISIAAMEIYEMSEIFHIARNSMRRRCQIYQIISGGNFKNILY